MGTVLSVVNTVGLAIKALLSMNNDLQDLLKRANSLPGLPVPNPTKSYWLQDPPHPELVDKQSEQFPTTADVVIIGSGITGAAVARSLLHESSRKVSSSLKDGNLRLGSQGLPRVVVLEARSLCSGATGRNGGHIKVSPHELFDFCKDPLIVEVISRNQSFRSGSVYLIHLCILLRYRVFLFKTVSTKAQGYSATTKYERGTRRRTCPLSNGTS